MCAQSTPHCMVRDASRILVREVIEAMEGKTRVLECIEDSMGELDDWIGHVCETWECKSRQQVYEFG